MSYLKSMFPPELFLPENKGKPLTQEQYIKSLSQYVRQDFKMHMFIAALSGLLALSFTGYFITGLFL